MFNTKQDVLNAIEDLQMWFAAKPYGWRERATPQQLQQWTDREREQDNLIDMLENFK